MILTSGKPPKRRSKKAVVDIVNRMTELIDHMEESTTQWHRSEIDMLLQAVISHHLCRRDVAETERIAKRMIVKKSKTLDLRKASTPTWDLVKQR